MASVFLAIGNAVRSVIAGLTGAPATIEVRKDDTLLGTDTPPIVVITLGDEDVQMYLSGAGTATDQGDVLKTYTVGVTIYRTCQALLTNDMSDNQDFVLLCQQALNKKTLTGVPAVYGATIVRRTAWEHEPFGKGHEVSRFAVVFYASETRLGN